MYFDCTDSVFFSIFVHSIPLVMIWIVGFYLHYYKKTISKLGQFFCFIVSIVYIGVLYFYSFGFYFFGINLLPEKKSIELIYLYPERRPVINASEIIDAKLVPSYKGAFQIIIKTKSGKMYESAPSNKLDIDSKIKLVKAALLQGEELCYD